MKHFFRPEAMSRSYGRPLSHNIQYLHRDDAELSHTFADVRQAGVLRVFHCVHGVFFG
jgi:hypothetical protein